MIANRLKEMQVLTTVTYEYRKSGKAVTSLDADRPYDWNAKTVADILSREDYIGNTVNCRFTVPSYKNKRKMKRDSSEHIHFEHTHEPIIDMQTWETVQKLRQGNADLQAQVKQVSIPVCCSVPTAARSCILIISVRMIRKAIPSTALITAIMQKINARRTESVRWYWMRYCSRSCAVLPTRQEQEKENLRNLSTKKAPGKADGSLTPSSVNMKGRLKERRSLMRCSSGCMRKMSSAG